jgi:hypothetical protein
MTTRGSTPTGSIGPVFVPSPVREAPPRHSAGVPREITPVEAAPEHKVSQRRPTERVEHW